MRVADCTRCGLRIQIVHTGQPCLCGAATGTPYELEGFVFPTLEVRCERCGGESVVKNPVWVAWEARNPGLSHAARDLANDPAPSAPEEVNCNDCAGLGMVVTPEGEKVLALVMRRLHQHTRDQYTHIGKTRL